jgi:hypothetical protein
MKPYEPKNRDKTRMKGGGGEGQRAIQNQIEKEKNNKTMNLFSGNLKSIFKTDLDPLFHQ